MSYTAAVITVSDLGSRGLRQDTSGPAICAMLEEAGFSVTYTVIVPDEKEQISAALCDCADQRSIDLIVTPAERGCPHGTLRRRPRWPCWSGRSAPFP